MHLAFPSLLIALGATLCVAIALAILMFPALSADRMSDSNNWAAMTYLVLVGTVYLMVAGFLWLKGNY